MESVEKLERILVHYRQKLAEEQLMVANLTVRVEELSEHINSIEDELEGYRVSSQTGAADLATS